MFTKNSNKPELLPTLKLASPRDIPKNRFFSVNNSPARLDSLADLNEVAKTSHREEPKKLVNGINFTNFHIRTGSLVGQSERSKKSPTLFQTEFSPAETHMGFVRREENGKKIALWEKINKLKASLTRYNDPEEVIILPTRSEVKKIINCLEILNDPSSGLADLMSIVVKVLKASMFVHTAVIEPFEDKLYEDCDDELKTVVETCKKEGTPYYTLCIALLKEITSDTRRGQKMDKHYYEMQRLQEELENNQNSVIELTKLLKERISPKEHKTLLTELTSYKENLTEAVKENEALKAHNNEVIEENTSLRKQMDGELAEIERHVAQIQHLERARDNVIKETEESRKQIALMKLKIKGFKDVMDKIIIKLGNVKQQVFDLRHENEELLYQNEKLSLRAARGFEALTPRPDYRKLIEEKKLDMDVYDSTGRRQMVPTIKVVEDLLNRIQVANEKTKEGFSKKKGAGISKLISGAGAITSKIPSQGSKRPSLSLHPPKTRPSILDSISPSGQKNFFVKEPSYTSVTSPKNNGGVAVRTSGDVNHKEEKISNVGNEESEEESQSSDNEDTTQNLTINKSQSKSNLTGYLKAGMISKNDEKGDGAFGEDTIKQANHLIDFAVTTKKAIDKLD